MMNLRKFYLTIFLVPLIVSCTTPKSNPSSQGSGDSGDEPSITTTSSEEIPDVEEDIFDQGYTTISIDNEPFYRICEGLYANKEPGVYKFEFDLKFAYNKSKAKLYYNYDGETPVKNDLYYLQPFKKLKIHKNLPDDNDNIPMTTSVDEILDSYDGRCVSYNYINNIQNTGNYAFFHNASVIDITFVNQKVETNMSLTYLIDNMTTYTIPIISLSMPYRKWFGSPYYFYNNIKEEVEQRVQLEYFDPVNHDYWQRNSKIKVGGGWSKGYPQRTLNLNFKKDEKGNKNAKVDIPIFGDRQTCGDPDKDLTKHMRFRLHNGGNCFEQWSGFNDAILQRAMFGTNVSTTAYRPCLVYLNGEYWGLMALREHYCDYYVEQNYGVDDDNVTMFELKGDLIFDDGDEDGAEYINELKTLTKDTRFNNASTAEAAFQELAEMIDVDSFVDALLAEYYCCNWDYVGNANNLKMWRSMDTSSKKYEDGKWRFCLHDTDFAFSETTNYFDKNHQYSYYKFALVRCCMKSAVFRAKLVARAEELAVTNLSAKNLSDITLEMYEEVKAYKKDSGKRWGQPSNYYNTWQSYYAYLLNYYQNRSNGFVSQLKSTLNNQYGGY